MASYEELVDLYQDEELKDKVLGSVAISADTIRLEDPSTTNHANRLVWALAATKEPKIKRDEIMLLVLAINEAATVQNIKEALDSKIQTDVDSVIDFFAV